MRERKQSYERAFLDLGGGIARNIIFTGTEGSKGHLSSSSIEFLHPLASRLAWHMKRIDDFHAPSSPIPLLCVM